MLDHKHRLGFIGIGLMGKPMAHRLLTSGFVVNVYNRTEHKAKDMVQYGASFCATVAELVNKSEVIILCLADASAVESIVLGEHGILVNGCAGKLVIDLSSIDPESTREMAQQLQQKCQMD